MNLKIKEGVVTPPIYLREAWIKHFAVAEAVSKDLSLLIEAELKKNNKVLISICVYNNKI